MQLFWVIQQTEILLGSGFAVPDEFILGRYQPVIGVFSVGVFAVEHFPQSFLRLLYKRPGYLEYGYEQNPAE